MLLNKLLYKCVGGKKLIAVVIYLHEIRKLLFYPNSLPTQLIHMGFSASYCFKQANDVCVIYRLQISWLMSVLNRCTCRVLPTISSNLLASVIHIKTSGRTMYPSAAEGLSVHFRFIVITYFHCNNTLYEWTTAHSLITPPHTLHLLWVHFCDKGNPFFSEYFAIVNFESPCDALRVLSVEYAKSPANPIKWREFNCVLERTAHLISIFLKTEVRRTCMQVYTSDNKPQLKKIILRHVSADLVSSQRHLKLLIASIKAVFESCFIFSYFP